MPVRREFVSNLYRDLLGREGTDREIEGHLNNPGGEQGLIDFFKGSEEYTRKNGGTQTWQDVGGQVQAYTPPTSRSDDPTQDYRTRYNEGGNTAPPPPPAPSGGMSAFIPRANFDASAFNYGRPQDVAKSAKDSYLQLSAAAPPAPMHDRQAYMQWFNQYIAPGMNARGHRIINVTDNGFEYENQEGRFFVDPVQNLGAQPGTMQQRHQWLATPADDATRQRYAGSGGGAGGGGSTTQRTTQGIANLYSQLGQQYGGPGGQGVMNGPLQQVGQDPLSQLITGGLADMILNQGATADGQDIMASLRSIIDNGGALPGDANVRNKRFESARELMAKGERTAMNDARAALASRGLMSEPGNASGAESSTIGRVHTRNAEEFARALRDIGIAEDDANNTRLTTAMSLATGMATDQARTMLASLGAGSDRQNMLAQIALESLGQNMAWNQFLAQFGLERDKVMYQIQNGNIDQMLPYLQMFMQLAQTTTRGFI